MLFMNAAVFVFVAAYAAVAAEVVPAAAVAIDAAHSQPYHPAMLAGVFVYAADSR